MLRRIGREINSRILQTISLYTPLLSTPSGWCRMKAPTLGPKHAERQHVLQHTLALQGYLCIDSKAGRPAHHGPSLAVIDSVDVMIG